MPYVNCKICESKFYVKPNHQKKGWGKCCSMVCRNQYQKTGKYLSCTICGNLTWRGPAQIKHSTSGKFFCGKSCQALWRNSSVYIEEKSSTWKDGRNAYRKILSRRTKELKCSLCGFEDSRALAVHHVDKDRKNNSVENLAWLCHNCHFLIHHYDKELAVFTNIIKPLKFYKVVNIVVPLA